MAISGFVEFNGVEDVGGLYPMLRVRGRRFLQRGYTVSIPKPRSLEREADVVLTVEGGKWVQKNIVTNKVVPLELLWELPKVVRESLKFDDVDRRRWLKNRPT
jgi:hypothetical protein